MNPPSFPTGCSISTVSIDAAIEKSRKLGIKDKEVTPFLLAEIKEQTGGESLESNIMLVLNNASVAAKTAAALTK